MVESAVKRQILAIVNITILVVVLLYGVIRPYHQYTGVLHVVNRWLPHGDRLIDGDVGCRLEPVFPQNGAEEIVLLVLLSSSNTCFVNKKY